MNYSVIYPSPHLRICFHQKIFLFQLKFIMSASQPGSQKNTAGPPGVTQGLCVSLCSQTSFSPSVPQGMSRKQALSQLSISAHTHLPGSTFQQAPQTQLQIQTSRSLPCPPRWPDPKPRNNRDGSTAPHCWETWG